MSLKDEIIADIKANGPMLLSVYMSRCNEHYYSTRIPFGKDGDFITAPDISQMFGELIGLWCADLWQRAGLPDPFRLVELGPGRGTLMADALRATKNVPGFHAALTVHFVEISPVLREEQKKLVPDAVWHDSVESFFTADAARQSPEGGPCIVIANEFFDALPIEQFTYYENSIYINGVDVADSGEGLMLIQEPCPHVYLSEIPSPAIHIMDWSIYERADYLDTHFRRLVEGLSDCQGGILVIDYGYTNTNPDYTNVTTFGDSLQVVKDHDFATPEDLLEYPGEHDITAHVNFKALATIAEKLGTLVHPATTQGQFLRKLGLDARAATLARAHPERAEEFLAQAARLADADQMGTLFKVMAITSKNWPTPAGFET